MYNLRLEYSKGHPLNLIAKLLMNSLYGKFGMRLESTKVEMFNLADEFESNLFKDLVELYGKTVKDFIKLDNFIVTVRDSLLHYEYNENEDMFHGVDINVAVAAAVTAYARIHMIYYKLLPGTVYTDTDSIFTTDILPELLIGDDLGMMKDELFGKIIQEALFLGQKKYGFWFKNDDGNKVEKSVFAGVKRDSLSFNEIIDLYQGFTLHKTIDNRFYKSFNDLNISVKSANISIIKSDRKLLVDNIYLPPHIENGQLIDPLNIGGRQFNYLKNQIFIRVLIKQILTKSFNIFIDYPLINKNS